jgi:hypothetical protein
MLPEFLDPRALRAVSMVIIVILALLVFLVVRMATKMVTRVVMLGILIALGVGVWVQRAELEDCRVDGQCEFFGFDVQVSEPQHFSP